MKYCIHCGAQLHEEAVICVKCGCSVKDDTCNAVEKVKSDDTLETVIKVFLIIGCVAQGWLLIPLAWCLPITISVFKSLKENKPIGTGMKICTLLFVNMIAGICMLCINDNKQ